VVIKPGIQNCVIRVGQQRSLLFVDRYLFSNCILQFVKRSGQGGTHTDSVIEIDQPGPDTLLLRVQFN